MKFNCNKWAIISWIVSGVILPSYSLLAQTVTELNCEMICEKSINLPPGTLAINKPVINVRGSSSHQILYYTFCQHFIEMASIFCTITNQSSLGTWKSDKSKAIIKYY